MRLLYNNSKFLEHLSKTQTATVSLCPKQGIKDCKFKNCKFPNCLNLFVDLFHTV